MKRVIAYASRGVTKAEKKYPTHKLEFLALKWAVCEKFKDYLAGQKFVVKTDNNPLTYVLSSAKLDATSQRWVAALASYEFSIIYRPGHRNADADGMSRHPLLENSEDASTIDYDTIKALCNSATLVPSYAENLCLSQNVLDTFEQQHDNSEYNIQKEQQMDPILGWWLPFIRRHNLPLKSNVPLTPVHSMIWKNFDKFYIEDGILYKKTQVDEETRKQLVLPKCMVPVVLNMLHNEMGHLGREKTISLIQERFYWYGMFTDVEEWIKSCDRCIRRKTPGKICASLINIHTYQPLELVCMDFLSLETSKGGHCSILVITDHFTRYAVAVPTRNQLARTTAEAFFHNFVVHYGLPQRIHTDQGTNFEGKLIKELCNLTGINKSHTTPYHPQGNGLCERFNRTLLGMMGTLKDTQKQDWKSYVSSLVHAYNSTKQESTGYSPYYLMFGRNPRLPIDLAFGLEFGNTKEPLNVYVRKLRNNLKNAYEIAAKSSEKSKERQKSGYDNKVRRVILNVGDRVLVKSLAFQGKHKLADRWEQDPYIVIAQPNMDMPVFDVKKESGEGKKRTLHRNLLLPISCISDEIRPIPKPRKKVSNTRNVPENKDRDEGTAVTDIGDTSITNNKNDQDKEDIEDVIEIHEFIEDAPEQIEKEGHIEEALEENTEDDHQIEEQQEETTEIDGNHEETANSPEGVRRSSRQRREPHWTKDYIVGQAVDWERRATFLQQLACSANLSEKERNLVTSALIQLVTKPP